MTIDKALDHVRTIYPNILRANYYGSHQFGLENENSDIDLLVVVSRDYSFYTSLKEKDLSIKSIKFDGVDIQLMDIRRYLQLIESSNFVTLVSLYNPIYVNPFYNRVFDINVADFNLNKIGHHLLGMCVSNRQKLYMRAYCMLFLEYIMSYKALPSSLDHNMLLVNYNLVLSNILDNKKYGTPLHFDEVTSPYSHDNINNVLTDTNSPNCNVLWANHLENLRQESRRTYVNR
jgi:predicted nucleotidyltransferase